MILNSGNPAWPHTLKPAPEYPALDQDVDCDFLIVGGGMSGAMMAYQLAARHQNIVLIDKRNIGGGSTAANTVFASKFERQIPDVHDPHLRRGDRRRFL